MNALISIGLQNDFLAGGALAVPGGDAVIAQANELQGVFRLVVATQQWHPPNHRSFYMNHTGRVAGESVKVGRIDQVLKPIHCVQNTYGADLSPALTMHRVNKVIRLGTDADLDDDSGFFDARQLRTTGLSDYLHEKKVRKIYVMGLTTEQAVMATALDGIGLGFKAWVVVDACRPQGTSPGAEQKAWEEMKAAGVGLVTSSQLIATFRAKAQARTK
jgi:nicotinamidase/pyrazinamidase